MVVIQQEVGIKYFNMKLHEIVEKEIGKILTISLFCGGLAVAGVLGDKYQKNHSSVKDFGVEADTNTYSIPYVNNPILQKTNKLLQRYEKQKF